MRRMPSIPKVILLAALLACPAVSPASAAGTRVSGPGFDGVVWDMPSPTEDVEVWVPAYGQIAEMEKAFVPYVKNYLKTHHVVLRKPVGKYKRHYVGILDKGKRLIGVSYYYDQSDFVASKRWLTEAGGADCQGDDCMGSVYDVELKAFVLFEIHPGPGKR